MSEKLREKVPANLKLSISNLWDKLGNTDSPGFGLLINLSLAATGVAIVLLVSNPIISLIGAAWAILNLLGVLSWVFGL
jgi:hypothetical protein